MFSSSISPTLTTIVILSQGDDTMNDEQDVQLNIRI